MSLTQAALAIAGPARPSLARLPELEAMLEALWRQARAVWPELAPDARAFVRHLVARLPADTSTASLRALHAGDLYLVCACLMGDATALALFDDRFICRITTPRGGPTSSQELQQLLRARLLIATAEQPARLQGYAGRGPLAGWLRVIAARLIVDERRAADPSAAPLDEHAPGPAAVDPETAYLKRRYAEPFARALEAALGHLPARDANVLRLATTEGLGGAAIGKLYRVSERTVQRWLVDIRGRLLEATHAQLAAELRTSPSEVASLYVLVRSEIDVRVPRPRR